MPTALEHLDRALVAPPLRDELAVVHHDRLA